MSGLLQLCVNTMGSLSATGPPANKKTTSRNHLGVAKRKETARPLCSLWVNLLYRAYARQYGTGSIPPPRPVGSSPVARSSPPRSSQMTPPNIKMKLILRIPGIVWIEFYYDRTPKHA